MSAIAAAASSRTVRVDDRKALVDGGFVLVLGGIGLLGFRTTYGGITYLVIGMAALAVGIGISEITRRMGKTFFADISATVVVFFLLGGLVALRGATAGGAIPSPATVTALFDIGFRGWKDLLTTKPPVGNNSGLLTIPFMIGLLGGTSAYSLARRTRLIAVPALIPVAILVLGILFGTERSAALLVQGSLFSALVLVWMSIRSQRIRQFSTTKRPGRNRVLSAIAIVASAAILAPFIGPNLPFAGHHRRVVLARYVIPPFDSNSLSSPLAAFRDYTPGSPKSLARVVLFTVSGINPGSLVRIATMDSYNGLVWGFGAGSASTGSASGTNDPFYRYGTVIPSSIAGQVGTVTVHLEHAVGAWLPNIGQLTRISFLGSEGPSLAQNFRYDPTTGTAVDTALSSTGVDYRMQTVVPAQPSANQLATAGAGSDLLAVTVPGPLQTQAATWVGTTTGAWNMVMKLSETLKTQGRFSNGTENPPLAAPGHSAGRLEQFIAGSPLVGKQIVGDDEQYAATLALMANAVGVPARVVLGAQVPAGGAVRGIDVHAWVEVSLAGLGWVTVDPSRFLPTKTPSHVLPQTQPAQLAQSPVTPPIVSILRPPPNDALPQSAAPSSRILPPKLRAGFHIPGILVDAAKFVGPPLLVLVAWAGTIFGLKSRRRRHRRLLGPTALRMASAWRELTDIAHDLGHQVSSGLTRREQAVVLPAPNAHNLAQIADAAVFGPDDPSPEQVEQYWREMQDTGRHLKASASRWQRIRGALSPASLRKAVS